MLHQPLKETCKRIGENFERLKTLEGREYYKQCAKLVLMISSLAAGIAYTYAQASGMLGAIEGSSTIPGLSDLFTHLNREHPDAYTVVGGMTQASGFASLAALNTDFIAQNFLKEGPTNWPILILSLLSGGPGALTATFGTAHHSTATEGILPTLPCGLATASGFVAASFMNRASSDAAFNLFTSAPTQQTMGPPTPVTSYVLPILGATEKTQRLDGSRMLESSQ